MEKKDRKLFWKVVMNRLKRRFVKNPIDKRVENFILSISANDDLKKVLNHKELATIYAFMVKKLYDLGNFHYLYTEIIIPRQLRHIKKMNRYSEKSFYIKLLNKPTRFDNGVFEVTRIGYVHLYHKYESYIQELCPFLDEYLTNTFNEQISILKFLKESLFGYDLFDLKYQPPELQKINWVGNCVKHYDSFPRKKNPPPQFVSADPTQQIKIGQEEFEKDILFLLNYFSEIFTICLFVGYSDYGIKIARRSTASTTESVTAMETTLKAALIARLMILTGRFKDADVK